MNEDEWRMARIDDVYDEKNKIRFNRVEAKAEAVEQEVRIDLKIWKSTNRTFDGSGVGVREFLYRDLIEI
jgi:hypothetical protein